jgi:hypothetical protein
VINGAPNSHRRIAAVVGGATGVALLSACAVLAFAPTRHGASAPAYVSTASGEYVEQAVSWFPEWITLPQGYSRSAFAFAVAQRLMPSRAGYLQKSRIQAGFETYSRCVWMQDWMSANVANDLGEMTAAASVLHTSATWPATVDTAAGRVPGLLTLSRQAAELELAPVEHEFSASCPTLPESSVN